jgi:hypothetical protein
MLLLQQDTPPWLAAANIGSVAIIYLAIVCSTSALLVSYLKGRNLGKIKLRQHQADLSGRAGFNATLLSHLGDDLGDESYAEDIQGFWKKVS